MTTEINTKVLLGGAQIATKYKALRKTGLSAIQAVNQMKADRIHSRTGKPVTVNRVRAMVHSHKNASKKRRVAKKTRTSETHVVSSATITFSPTVVEAVVFDRVMTAPAKISVLQTLFRK